MKHAFRGLLGLLMLAGMAFSVSAQTDLRRIDVTGDAEIRVSPDEAVLSLGVESWALELAKARKDNDDAMARILKVPAQFGVDKKLVQTDYLAIEPLYEQNEGPLVQYISSYRVRKNITIVLKDLSKLDALVNALLNAGANSFGGIEFRSTELRSLRDKARAMAVQAAREKAGAMAAILDQKLLAPIQINELNDGPFPAYRTMAQNVSSYAEGSGTMGETLSVGQIVIRSQVSVSFEIGPR